MISTAFLVALAHLADQAITVLLPVVLNAMLQARDRAQPPPCDGKAGRAEVAGSDGGGGLGGGPGGGDSYLTNTPCRSAAVAADAVLIAVGALAGVVVLTFWHRRRGASER